MSSDHDPSPPSNGEIALFDWARPKSPEARRRLYGKFLTARRAPVANFIKDEPIEA